MKKRVFSDIIFLCILFSNIAGVEMKAVVLTPEQLEDITITAETRLPDGKISINSAFIVSVSDGVTETQLKGHIAVEPAIAYKPATPSEIATEQIMAWIAGISYMP